MEKRRCSECKVEFITDFKGYPYTCKGCTDRRGTLDDVYRLSRIFFATRGSHGRMTNSTELVKAIQTAYDHGYSVEDIENLMSRCEREVLGGNER